MHTYPLAGWHSNYFCILSLHSAEARRSSGRAAELDFHVDVAPRSHSSIRLRPLHREEAGRGVFSPSSTSHRRWIRCRASTVGISVRTRRRSVGFRRDLVRWIRDFERNPRSPYLLDLSLRLRLLLLLSGARQGRHELEPYLRSRARGTPTAGTAVASYTGEIPLYTADLSACPGNV
uniref:Uncharacterized protein n=1 Tax=Ananas comosus var. bracteatus TaxID=296719 RepID=A0A6V7PL21_ANACO|nr:unnamed protein product [Ananas comosus var. bracteatus]